MSSVLVLPELFTGKQPQARIGGRKWEPPREGVVTWRYGEVMTMVLKGEWGLV